MIVAFSVNFQAFQCPVSQSFPSYGDFPQNLVRNDKGVLDEARQKELETRCFDETIFVYDDSNLTRVFEGGREKEVDQDGGKEGSFGKTEDDSSLKQEDKRESSGKKKKNRRRTTKKSSLRCSFGSGEDEGKKTSEETTKKTPLLRCSYGSGEDEGKTGGKKTSEETTKKTPLLRCSYGSGEDEGKTEGKKTSEETDSKEKILKDVKERGSVGRRSRRGSGEGKRASSGEKSEAEGGSFTMSGKRESSKGEKEGLEVLLEEILEESRGEKGIERAVRFQVVQSSESTESRLIECKCQLLFFFSRKIRIQLCRSIDRLQTKISRWSVSHSPQFSVKGR